MQDTDKRDKQPGEENREQKPAEKPEWVKPAVRARGSFDKQALACARPQFGPPFCQGGAS